MKRFLLICLVLLVATSGYCANKWTNLDTAFIDGDAVLFNDIDTNLTNYVIEPLERYLLNARQGLKVSYTSATTVTVAAGSVVCSNAAGTLLDVRRNTATTAVTFANIDTGIEQASKTYYIYATSDVDATTATFKISLSATTPTGLTYYKRIGSFYNNSSSNIEQVANDDESVIISTGTVANAATISLPSGYSQDECSWMVGLGSGAVTGSHPDGVYYTVTSNTSRVATCTYTAIGAGAAGTCTANYIIGCHR